MTDRNICVQIIDTPIQWDQLISKVADPDAGAHGWFVGVTRRTTDSRVTETLAYEAHLPMATRELEKIAAAAIENFSLFQVVIVHRLGEVPIGEASVVVGCSSGHRPETFEALSWIMDTLKREVPIWKREQYVDGSTEWVHPTPADSEQA
ncbi:MAG: molybdenum cofactor biosynthesis protein MoaE [Planctomycetota bacterium]|nr:molybdenum cofactor biosynthesis protein MoaE [Planctomycetota bacterium]